MPKLYKPFCDGEDPKANDSLQKQSMSSCRKKELVKIVLNVHILILFWLVNQGCALREISGSPSGSQAFYLSHPDLKVGRPNKNFGEPFGLPSIPAGVPWPLKLVTQVHLMRKYFEHTRILLVCWSPNSVILAFGFDKNPLVVLWNPSKFSCHSDLKPETWAMPPNCLGFKERKVKNFSRFT